MNRKTLILSALALTVTGSGCYESISAKDPIRLMGRVSFLESSGCDQPVSGQRMTWAECHAFKKHFDPSTGQPINENYFNKTAHRPLPSMVRLTVLNPLDPSQVCAETEVRTDEQGYFDTTLGSCGYGFDVLVAGQAHLRHTIRDGSERPRSIVALWKEDQAEDLFEDLGQHISQDYAFTSGGSRYAVPSAGFIVSQATQCTAENCLTPIYQLGSLEVIADSANDSFGYLRQVMSAYTTVISLHERLQNELAQPGRLGESLDYFKMFSAGKIEDWGPTYRVYFANDWAAAGTGTMNLYGPNRELFETNGLSPYTWLLSSTYTLPHEFGHSIHGSLANSTFLSDYEFANPLMRANGEEYDWGHSNGQYQEIGTALTEGLASSLGQYLLNHCQGGSRRILHAEGGSSDFASNMWNPDVSCDAKDGCSYHHARWHLVERGVRDGSAEFGRRVLALQNLTTFAIEGGHTWTVTNSEGRVAAWGCDLLDDNTDVKHASFTPDFKYLDDFTYLVGQALDGSATSPLIRSYPNAPVAPEEVHLSLTELIQVLGGFCENCSASVAPRAAWGQRYNLTRLSVHESPLSPQSFMKKLIADGYATREQADAALQSNLMELLKN